jgi:8-oxo-dGTP pyrophosphatase MutT (NUDIX family)
MEKVINQVGVVPYYFDNGIKKIILITAKNPRRNWIVPKGHIEKELSPEKSAAKEAFEEAGLKGNLKPKIIGSLFYKKKDKEYQVDFYPFEITEILNDWSEKESRERIAVEQDYVKRFVLDEKLLEILKLV